MASSWLRWSSSPQVLSLLDLVAEFIDLVWTPFALAADARDEHYDVEGQFKVFSRPRRVLEQLMVVESICSNVKALQSFSSLVEAFHRVEVAESVCTRMFTLAKTRILHNSGRYLFGVYLWTGFGDPDFALIVWEAMSHYKKHKNKPKKRTEEGKRLEQLLLDCPIRNEYHQSKFAALTTQKALDQLNLALVELRRGRKDLFVQAVLKAEEGSILRELRLWLPALSNTRVVERCFLHWDNLAFHAGSGTKTAASEASGKVAKAEITGSRVAAARAVCEVEEHVLREQKKVLKRVRVRAKDDVCATAQNAFQLFLPSDEELKRARDTTNAINLEWAEPREGVSIISQKQLRELEEKAESLDLPRKTLAMLLKGGESVVVELLFTCFSGDDCVKREAKGRKGDVVKCAQCDHFYHQKCLENSGMVEKGTRNEDVELTCAICSPSAEIEVRKVGRDERKKK